MIVDHVQAELGAVELFCDVTESETELPVVTGVEVLADGRHFQRIAERRGHAVGVQAGAAQDLSEQRVIAQPLVQTDDIAKTGHRAVQGGAAEVVVGGVAAVGEQVGLGVESADRVDAGFLPVGLVETLQCQVVGQADVETDGFHRHQYFLHLSARQTKLRRIHRVGGVDPAAIEHALAPVEYLAPEARGQRHLRHVPAAIDIGVEHLDVVTGDVAGLVGETVVVGEVLARLRRVVVVVVIVALVHQLGVVERGTAHEHPVVLVVGFQLRGDLVDLRSQPGVEVAIAVVGVDVIVAFVPPLDPPQAAIGQGGVERAGDLVVQHLELDGLRALERAQLQQPRQPYPGHHCARLA
ncbi:hypothetical protein D3C78_648160 [compost metagenome]